MFIGQCFSSQYEIQRTGIHVLLLGFSGDRQTLGSRHVLRNQIHPSMALESRDPKPRVHIWRDYERATRIAEEIKAAFPEAQVEVDGLGDSSREFIKIFPCQEHHRQPLPKELERANDIVQWLDRAHDFELVFGVGDVWRKPFQRGTRDLKKNAPKKPVKPVDPGLNTDRMVMAPRIRSYCPCCNGMNVWRTPDRPWFCFYCDPQNTTFWRCALHHTQPPTKDPWR